MLQLIQNLTQKQMLYLVLILVLNLIVIITDNTAQLVSRFDRCNTSLISTHFCGFATP